MKINLRKADALAKAFLSEGNALGVSSTVEVNHVNLEAVQADPDLVQRTFKESLAQRIALLDMSYRLRGLLGVEFATTGISEHLTNLKRLETEERILNEAYTTSAAGYRTVAEAAARVAELRDAPQSGYGSRQSPKATLGLPADALKSVDDQRRSVRRQITSIKDRLLGLNLSNHLELPSDMVAMAEKLKLI